MRVLEPASGVLAFYDGRVDGARLHSAEPNWLDDGGFTLGIASFAVVDGDEALVYDTHLTVDHARRIRAELEARGATRLRVLLSHWHLDHVAGNEAFADCEIIAHAWTLEELVSRRAAIEDGTLEGPPPINPLVLPQTTFEDELELTVGRTRLTVRHLQIHSRDAAVVLLDGGDLVLAGDTLEDTITYVSESAPDRAPPGRAGSHALLGRDAVPAVPRRPGADRGRRLRAHADRRHVALHPAAARRARRRRGGRARPARVRAAGAGSRLDHLPPRLRGGAPREPGRGRSACNKGV